MKHASLPLLLFLCRCRQRKVKINEIVKFKFLAGTTRCQTTNNSSCGLLVVYRNCCLGLYIFVKGFRRANKQPRPQGFSLKKWVGRPTHFLREKPWERGWANKQRGLYPRELIHNGIEKVLRNKPWQC